MRHKVRHEVLGSFTLSNVPPCTVMFLLEKYFYVGQ